MLNGKQPERLDHLYQVILNNDLHHPDMLLVAQSVIFWKQTME